MMKAKPETFVVGLLGSATLAFVWLAVLLPVAKVALQVIAGIHIPIPGR